MFNIRWATPVVSIRWAFVTWVLDKVSRWSGYRVFSTARHTAFQKATCDCQWNETYEPCALHA